MLILEKLLIREVERILKDLKSGNCSLSEEEQSDLLSMLMHKSLSAEEVCSYLNISRPTLTNYIRDGVIPKGRKLKGRKELVWFKDEISKKLNH